jgi:hypothetical protein
VLAPAGTVVEIEFVAHDVIVALIPLNFTELPLGSAPPKSCPAIITEAPAAPDDGDKFMICGAAVNGLALLGIPDIVTVTGPEVA